MKTRIRLVVMTLALVGLLAAALVAYGSASAGGNAQARLHGREVVDFDHVDRESVLFQMLGPAEAAVAGGRAEDLHVTRRAVGRSARG